MDDHELQILLSDLESDRADRKASISDNKKIRSTICAFANDLPDNRKPGVLFIGANDDGTCASLPITDDLLKKLSDIRSDGSTMPFPSMDIQKRTINGCEMAVVIVQPSDNTPVRYSGRIYVRVGPTTRVASQQDERRLIEKRRSKDIPYDIQPVPSASLDDLDISHFRETYLASAVPVDVLDQNTREIKDQLSGLRLITVGSDPVPTVLGIIVSGKDTRRFIPGAYVQFVRFDGINITDPIKDQKTIGGTLLETLRMMDEVFNVHVSVSSDIINQPVEIRSPDYPLSALQQLARNAIMHRSYEGTNSPVRIFWFNDRIEMSSPGGLFGRVTKENFGNPGVTDYRNPNLAEAMKSLGYAQQFGLGIELSRNELKKNGNPPPEFTVSDTAVLAIIRRRP